MPIELFPVLCFSQDIVSVSESADQLTTCSKVGLKKGYFRKLIIIDSAGALYKVNGAKKLCGVGPFWGYNIFLNQKIRVELSFKENPSPVSLQEVKNMVFMSFRKWHGWATRGDFEELNDKITNAQTFSEVIELLKDSEAIKGVI